MLLLICLFFNISHTTIERSRFSLLDATKLGSKKLVLTALSRDDNPNQKDEFGNTPLHYAAHMQNRTITDILLDWHADPNIQNRTGKTALHLAAQTSNDYITRRLLLYGARAETQDQNGNTPLHLAAFHADLEPATDIAMHLIASNPAVNLKNSKDQTAHMIAMQVKQKHQSSCSRKKLNIKNFIKALSFTDAKTDQIHVLNRHYIQCAKTDNIKAMRNISTYPTVKKNLQYGKHQRTALMYAAHNNRTCMAEYLVNQLHVDKNIKDRYGKTAFNYAQKYNNRKLNQLLI